MAYVTPAQLAEKPGATELAQVATAEHEVLVGAALMEATLRGEDRSGFDPADVVIADDALARINQVIAEVDETIDAYIRTRVASVPMLPVPSVLTRIARAMVRYELHKDLAASDREHPIVRDYRDKLALLESIRDGKVMLGGDDPAAAGKASAGPQWTAPARVFDRDSLRDY